jgi:hypothetical protein
MSDKHQFAEAVSKGGIALNFRVITNGEPIPHNTRNLAAVAELEQQLLDKARAEPGPIGEEKRKACAAQARLLVDIAERAAAISYMCPELNTDEAKALAQIEPRLSFHPRAIQKHVLAHIDAISVPVTAKG